MDELLADVRNGQSAVLVVRGEAGVGKTALLDQIAARASGLRVAQISGTEAEMELAFAGLHQLCAPLLDQLDRLPAPQAGAIATAFGLRDGQPPDRFLVGLAVLSLLAESAAKKPLVCVIDDLQWLDSASVQTMLLVARRLRAESILMLFAVRDDDEGRELPGLHGLPELNLAGLDESESRALLATAMPGLMDDRVRERILAEARGNPLALLELPRDRSPSALAGGYNLMGQEHPLTSRIERGFAEQVRKLPPETRQLLLVAAVDPLGDATLLWQACVDLGLGPEASSPAETAELISISTRVQFRHPLVRSAVYSSASVQDRRRAHQALADAIDPRIDSEHRAWHRAHATSGADEQTAAELAASAVRARARGGMAAAAAFLAYAADLTPEPQERGRRALAAAEAKLAAGAPDEASELVALAEAVEADPLQHARIDLVRAQIAFARRRGRDAPGLLLAAAERLRELDPPLSRETYLEALTSSVFAGRLAWSEEHRPAGVARAAQAAPPAADPPRTADQLLDGLILRFTKGYPAAAALLKQAVGRFRQEDAVGEEDLRWYGIVGRITLDLWAEEDWDRLAARQVEVLRSKGELARLALALNNRAGVSVHAGRFDEAVAMLEESRAITDAIGVPPPLYIEPVLAAYRGDQARTLELVRKSLHSATIRGEGSVIAVVQYAAAVLYNSLGEYQQALAATSFAIEHDDLGMYGYVLLERIEAAAGCGEHAIAAEAMRDLAERAEASGTEMALGVAARSRALLLSGAEADEQYRTALEHLGHGDLTVLQARVHLIYGEWLRGEGRRAESIDQLTQAHEAFQHLGADGFADRARRDLVAAGEAVRSPAAAPVDALTGQETYIARLAAEGKTNQEIATQLFLSPRTVEWHLGKIFAKLQITSRRALRTALTTGT